VKPEEKPAAAEEQTPQRPLVLVVDDDAATREMCEVLLGGAGYTTVLAASGDEALQLLETIDPKLIVLDLSMPGMDGFSAAHTIRSRPKTARTPILVLTGLSIRVESAARRAGATAFCAKPIDPKRFVAEVRKLCPA
jgi:CheY-like chemotaxis protein